MTAMRFLDTNILLYKVSQDPAEAERQAIAAEILEADDPYLSVQVLQEFYVQATRPNRADRLLHEEACGLIESWKRYPIVDISTLLFDAALQAKERWQLSYWDAAILEAARLANCETLLSEDLNHGQSYEGVRVVNPFV